MSLTNSLLVPWVFSLRVLQLLLISVLSSAVCRPKRQAADPVVSPASAKKQLPPQPRRGAQQIYNPPSGKYSATISTFSYGEKHLLFLLILCLLFFFYFLFFLSFLCFYFLISFSNLLVFFPCHFPIFFLSYCYSDHYHYYY